MINLIFFSHINIYHNLRESRNTFSPERYQTADLIITNIKRMEEKYQCFQQSHISAIDSNIEREGIKNTPIQC